MTAPEQVSEGILTADEQELLKRVRNSRVWKLIQDSLCWERETLFGMNPATTEELWKTWGAIQQVQKLLREAPLLVIWYRRYMAERETQAAGKTKAAAMFDREPGDFSTVPEFDH